MQIRVRVLVGIIAALVLSACIVRKEVRPSQVHLDRLVNWMSGSFSTQEQALVDSAFLDIRLESVQIWPERIDGRWMYVEQASAVSLDRPYRQRVYRLSRRNDTTLVNSVYELREPLRFAGAWRTPSTFDFLTPDSLMPRPGCAVVLHPRGDTAFVGSTVDRECQSDHRGAAYTTAEVRITELRMVTWDRGWDSTGTQVWGSERGGYVFKRLREP
ncbi:MAG: chromophore lyase CpcT/CpeT [Candidatus Zixiibacteriota bacterium]